MNISHTDQIRASIEEEIKEKMCKRALVDGELRALRKKLTKMGKDANYERKAPRRKVLQDAIVLMLQQCPNGLSPMMMYALLPSMTEETFEKRDVYNEIKIMKERYMIGVRHEKNKRLWTLCDKGGV